MECLVIYVLVGKICLGVDYTNLYLYPFRVLFLLLFVTVIFFKLLVGYFYFLLSVILSKNGFVEQLSLTEASMYFVYAISLNYEFYRFLNQNHAPLVLKMTNQYFSL